MLTVSFTDIIGIVAKSPQGHYFRDYLLKESCDENIQNRLEKNPYVLTFSVLPDWVVGRTKNGETLICKRSKNEY